MVKAQAFDPVENRRQVIFETLSDTVSRFLYYDRKEDEALPVGRIEEAIKNGWITVEEIVAFFKEELEKSTA
jgi:hypothetical protein